MKCDTLRGTLQQEAFTIKTLLGLSGISETASILIMMDLGNIF